MTNRLPPLIRCLAPSLFDPPPFSHLRGDLTGAMAGMLASLPQSLALGAVAGAALGPSLGAYGLLAGLYGSVLVAVVAAVFGGCPVMLSGPRAATILIFSGLVAQLMAQPSLAALPELARASSCLALAGLAVALAGLAEAALGALRMGRLARFIPYPVVSGFLNGSALLILLSQVWSATGIAPQHSLLDLFSHLSQIAPATLALALGTTLVILMAPPLPAGIPNTVLGLVAGLVCYHLLDRWAGLGAALGGTVPALPEAGALAISPVLAVELLFRPGNGELWGMVVWAAVIMAALAALDALLAASAADALLMRRSDGDRELMAQGAANVLAGLLGLLPGSGSMTRTGSLLKAGGRTVTAPLLTSLLVLALTKGLAPLLTLVPRAVMAGLLIAVAIDLLDRRTLAQARGLLKAGKGLRPVLGDLGATAIVVATTLVFNLAAAVGVGVLVSLVAFVAQMARSPIRRCYRATAQEPRLMGDERRRRFIRAHGGRMAVIEMEGALFFGSAAEVEAQVERLIQDGVSHIALDLKRVKGLDGTGARALERIHDRLARTGGMLAVGYVERERRARDDSWGGADRRRLSAPRQMWRTLDALGTLAHVGAEHFVPDIDQAVALCERDLAARLGGGQAGGAREGMLAILKDLEGDAARQLRSYLTRHSYGAGQVVFPQGGPPDSVYFIASGRVEVTIDLPMTERKLRVHTMARGAVFGEMALIDPKPRSANIVAMEPTVCWRLSSEDFLRLKSCYPELAFRLISNVALLFSERLRAANVLMAELEA